MLRAVIQLGGGQSAHHMRQLRHRIFGQMRIGDMALCAADSHNAVYRPAPPDFNHIAQRVGICRLTNHTIINNLALLLQPAEHFARAVNAGAFFIAGNQQRD